MIILGIIFFFLIYACLVGLCTCFTKPSDTWLEDADYHFFRPNLRHRNYKDFR